MRSGRENDRPSIGSLWLALDNGITVTPQFVSGWSRLLLETEGAGLSIDISAETIGIGPLGINRTKF